MIIKILDELKYIPLVITLITLLTTLMVFLMLQKKNICLLKKSLYSQEELADFMVWFSLACDILFCTKLFFFEYFYKRINFQPSNSSESLIGLENFIRIRIEYEFLNKKPNKKEDLTAWFKKMKQKLKSISTQSKEKVEIVVENCFIIQNKIDELSAYLELTKELKLNSPGESVLNLKVLDGFIAPLYLLTGPLKSFKEDWPKLLHMYRNSFDGNTNEIESVKRSNFSTWIGWGPSISLCTCSKWSNELINYGKTHNEPFTVRTTFQYGYGDENNSIKILLPNDRQSIETFIQKYNKFINQNQGTVNESPLAISATVKGKLKILEAESVLAPYPKLQPNYESEVLLSCEESNINIFSRNADESIDNRQYYTAYVWVLFEVIDLPFSEIKNNHIHISMDEIFYKDSNNYEYQEKPWRKLIPFFEHTNIADCQAYESQRKLLIYKSLKFIDEMKHQKLTFRYLCSFDHTNCSKNGSLRITYSDANYKNILDLIKEAMEQNFKDLPIILPNNLSGIYPKISSCYLVDLISKFNSFLAQI